MKFTLLALLPPGLLPPPPPPQLVLLVLQKIRLITPVLGAARAWQARPALVAVDEICPPS